MAGPLTARGHGGGAEQRLVGRVSRSNVAAVGRQDCVRIVSAGQVPPLDLVGYLAVLQEGPSVGDLHDSWIESCGPLDFLRDGDVALVEPHTGFVRSLYQQGSAHNALFATERCSNRCVMCSQPPRESNDAEAEQELLRIIDLIPDNPTHLGITGGEPTLLGQGLVAVLARLAARLPRTTVTMLSNGRLYCYEDVVARLASVKHTRFLTSIPLHGADSASHDLVAQASGAFDQTISGLYNAARAGLEVEVRVVLHRLSTGHLLPLCDFVYRNLPFVQQVVFMGLEHMGLARTNEALLKVDPVDYMEELERAVRYLDLRRVPVSLYNLPLCSLPRSLWSFSRQSISEHKNVFLEPCSHCDVRDHCAGFFNSDGSAFRGAVSPIQGTRSS